MLFKNAFEQQPTLRFVYEKLQFYSVLGRQFLLNQPFITDSDTLSAEHERLSEVMVLWQDTTLKPVFSHLSLQIHQLNNIAPTLSALENGAVLDDIQLFEIKKTAILTNFIAQDVKKLGISWLEYHPMEEVITILDPEHTFIPHFYVYSAYDEELACLREKMKSVNNAQEIETYRFQAQQVEDRLRAELSDKLRPYQESLSKNLRNTAYLDMLIAKAKLAIEWNACRPQISDRLEFPPFLCQRCRNLRIDQVHQVVTVTDLRTASLPFDGEFHFGNHHVQICRVTQVFGQRLLIGPQFVAEFRPKTVFHLLRLKTQGLNLLGVIHRLHLLSKTCKFLVVSGIDVKVGDEGVLGIQNGDDLLHGMVFKP